MRLARTLAVLVVLALGLGALLPPGATAAVAPGVWVSPISGLRDGSVVKVAGWGITPGATVEVRQCDTFTGDPDYDFDCSPVATATAGTEGRVRLSLRLADLVQRNQPFGGPRPVYCRADGCRVFLTWADDAGGLQVASSRTLRFDGSPATVAVDPSTDLVDGRWVRVSGTAVGAGGRRIQVVEQGCFEIVQGAGCYGALAVRRTRVRPGGAWSIGYRVSRHLADDPASDCTDPDILGSCVISATVLRPDGTPDDSFGVARLGEPAVRLGFAAD